MSFCVLIGLAVCESGEEVLKVRLLKLKLEVLVRSGEDKAADEALETLSQVIQE